MSVCPGLGLKDLGLENREYSDQFMVVRRGFLMRKCLVVHIYVKVLMFNAGNRLGMDENTERYEIWGIKMQGILKTFEKV